MEEDAEGGEAVIANALTIFVLALVALAGPFYLLMNLWHDSDRRKREQARLDASMARLMRNA